MKFTQLKSKINMFSILLNFIFSLSFALTLDGGRVLRHKRDTAGLFGQKRDASVLKGAMEDLQPSNGPWSPWN